MRTFPILLVIVGISACEADPPEAHSDAGSQADGSQEDGSAPDGSQADGSQADGSAPDGSAPLDAAVDMGPINCAEAWATPRLTVTAAGRPARAPGMQLNFDFGLTGGAHITLAGIDPDEVVRPSDGPFSVETHAGSWVELQGAAGATLYTRQVFELIGESLEAPPPPGDGGFMRIDRCPDAGFIRLGNLPNDPAATQVVLFQEVIDGMSGGPTVELARFALP